MSYSLEAEKKRPTMVLNSLRFGSEFVFCKYMELEIKYIFSLWHMWNFFLCRLCRLIHLYDPLKEEVHPAEVYLWVTKQGLKSIVYSCRFCRSTALLVVSLEKNLMELHSLLWNGLRRFSTNPFTFFNPFTFNSPLCIFSFSRTGNSDVYLSSLFYKFYLNVTNFMETHVIEW